MVDETMMLTKLLNVSDEESDLLEWCFFKLDEQQIESCLNDAKVIAAAEIRADDAAILLTAMFVKVIVRGIRWARLQRKRGESKKVQADEEVSAAEAVVAIGGIEIHQGFLDL
jgi:hypothetical protein